MTSPGPGQEPPQLRVSPAARRHILDGDESGGGHRAGTGRSEYYLRIQEELRRLLVDLHIDDSRSGHAREFIRHNELGLAFENIVAIAWIDRLPISPDQQTALSRLASEMRVDLDALRQRIADKL